MFACDNGEPSVKKQKTENGTKTVSFKDSLDDESREKESVDKNLSTSDTIQWEYKWEDNDSCEIHGPFSTTQMIEWKDSDYFKDGAFVRKVENSTDSWYKVNRIDFDLYT